MQGSNQFSSNSLTAELHTLTFAVTDTTGSLGSDTVTFRVNTPPTAPMVSLNAGLVYGTSTLTAAMVLQMRMVMPTYGFEWYENGVLHPSTLNGIGASDLDVGELWAMQVTPNDGYTEVLHWKLV